MKTLVGNAEGDVGQDDAGICVDQAERIDQREQRRQHNLNGISGVEDDDEQQELLILILIRQRIGRHRRRDGESAAISTTKMITLFIRTRRNCRGSTHCCSSRRTRPRHKVPKRRTPRLQRDVKTMKTNGANQIKATMISDPEANQNRSRPGLFVAVMVSDAEIGLCRCHRHCSVSLPLRVQRRHGTTIAMVISSSTTWRWRRRARSRRSVLACAEGSERQHLAWIVPVRRR